jgi:hypothetical protein
MPRVHIGVPEDFFETATIPPWLYQNTLPDDELQAVYVAQAQRKHREFVARRKALEAELADARAAEARAAAFLAEATAARERYRRGSPPLTLIGSRRPLPRARVREVAPPRRALPG